MAINFRKAENNLEWRTLLILTLFNIENHMMTQTLVFFGDYHCKLFDRPGCRSLI